MQRADVKMKEKKEKFKYLQGKEERKNEMISKTNLEIIQVEFLFSNKNIKQSARDYQGQLDRLNSLADAFSGRYQPSQTKLFNIQTKVPEYIRKSLLL